MLIVSVLVSRQVTEGSLQEIRHSLVVRSELLAEIAKPVFGISADVLAAERLQKTIVQLDRKSVV